MAINVSCACGHSFPVPSFMIGQEVTCSHCQAGIIIPKQDAVGRAPGVDKGNTLRRVRCQKCGNQIKITATKTFKEVQCAACGDMVSLDGGQIIAKPPEPPAPPPPPPPEPEPEKEEGEPSRDLDSPKAPPIAAAPPRPATAIGMPAVAPVPEPEVAPAAHASSVVDCGGCGKMFAATEAKCPFCFTPKGMGTQGRGRRQGTYVNDMFLAFAWGAKGILPLMSRWILVAVLWVAFSFIIGLLAPRAAAPVVITALVLMLAWVYGQFFSISFQVIRSGAARQGEFPPLPGPMELQEHFLNFLKVGAWVLFCFGMAILLELLAVRNQSCVLFLGATFFFVLGWPFFVLGYVGLGVLDQLFRLSPVGMVQSTLRNPVPLLILFGMTIVLAVVAGGALGGAVAVALTMGAASQSPAFAAFIAVVLVMPIVCYLMTVFWRMLGIFFYHNEEKLTLLRK